MKLVKLVSIILVTVFAVSIQSEAKFKIKSPVKKKEIKYDYEMNENSDLETDLKKLLPAKSEPAHQITEGVFGPADGSKGPILIVPYITGKDGKVKLMLLIPEEKMKYKKLMAGEIKFKKKGGEEVQSVFFDQADKDKERELFILFSITDVKGQTSYETAVLDWKKNKFERVEKLESKISGNYPAINVRRTLRAMESQSEVKKTKK